MKKLRTLIDTFTGKMYLVGPGGYEIHLSPGSEVHDLEESAAGHLMLPCSRFGRQHQQHTEDSQVFTVGEFFIAKPESGPQEGSPSYSGPTGTQSATGVCSSDGGSKDVGRHSDRFLECRRAVAGMRAPARSES